MLRQAGHPWAQREHKPGCGHLDNKQSAVQRKKVETRKTRLYAQQGPSCWLFVLEALAQAHGLKTSDLKVAMHAYPKGAELEGEDRRAEAVGIMAGNLGRMVQELKKHGENSPDISRQHVEAFAQATGTSNCLRFIKFSSMGVGENAVEIAEVEGLVDVFSKALRRAVQLQTIIESPESDMKTILGGDAKKVKAGSSKKSATDKLKDLREKMPVYLSVRKRYKPRDVDYPDPSQPKPDGVYWTERTDPMESTRHALLLTGYKKGIVSYKDPNFGDFEIRITVEQFAEMTGDKYLTMRAHDSENGALNELVD
ncbi:hypothetical protein [Streptomyces sp. AC512_CC834]|uniref:hypothetical protein n=1 Tax=Streptomyces sp. AC512_CC834 TaxID=2823691 RepID=UPI001C2542BE|nr:hypothetical protein [Streptomyces sp. AC512_CC834]